MISTAYNIGVFISHSWKYDNHYQKLNEWLFQWSWDHSGTPVRFIDYSIPRDNPIHNAPNSEELGRRIFAEVNKAHVVVIPMGIYSTYSQWISREIAASQQYRKPILGVDLWGAERKSSVVANASQDIAGWNRDSVGKGVWNLYRRYYNG